MGKEMETFSARLASFDLVLQAGKRSSGAKGARQISWPSNGPSPAEMAHAGFYYNPYETNPDNATCFLCERSIDGWDKDDNPIEEHLRLSGDCGWAIMMDIQQHTSNPAEIEDPTSENIVQARRATFNLSWPHDGKQGWICNSERMVDGGWYFCPTEDGYDQTSCPYCKLSLDGWDPDDDPYHEHYRRSSDCSFFVFAEARGKKKTRSVRSKKARGSKASRQSNQSITTATPDTTSIDFDDFADQGKASQLTSKAKTAKRAPKAKKSSRSGSVDIHSETDADDTRLALPEPLRPRRNAKSKKRSSDSANLDEQGKVDKEITSQIHSPPKKRATRIRASASKRTRSGSTDTSAEGLQIQDESTAQEKKSRRARPTKRVASSRGRKMSTDPATSRSKTESRIPRDSELDAMLKADLEGEASDADDHDLKPVGVADEEAKRTNTPVYESTSYKDTDQRAEHSWIEDNVDLGLAETQASPSFNVLRSGSSSPRDETYALTALKPRDTGEKLNKNTGGEGQKGSVENKKRESLEVVKTYPEPSQDSKEKITSDSSAGHSPKMQRYTEADSEKREWQEESQKGDSGSRVYSRRISMAPPKTAKRYSEIPHEQQFARSLAESQISKGDGYSAYASSPVREASDATSQLTPQMLSPFPLQSSDAENNPPCTNDSTPKHRMTFLSPNQLVQTPWGAKTPSPAAQNTNAGLKTSRPWTPVNIEDILLDVNSDKENTCHINRLDCIREKLSSPERKMTVEQWIFWNAKSGEDKLKRECERLVSSFEREGGRAMRALEGIECVD